MSSYKYLPKLSPIFVTRYFIIVDLAADTEDSSSGVTMNCVTISSTLIDEPSPLTVYTFNPSSNRAAADQRRRYVMGGGDWSQEVMSSSGDYRKYTLRP